MRRSTFFRRIIPSLIVGIFVFLLCSLGLVLVFFINNRTFLGYRNTVKTELYRDKLGSNDYDCHGTCFCVDEQRRFSSAVSQSKTTLLLTVAGVSTVIAYRTASQYFESECKSRYKDECGEDNIMFQVDECSKENGMSIKGKDANDNFNQDISDDNNEKLSADEMKKLWKDEWPDMLREQIPDATEEEFQEKLEEMKKAMDNAEMIYCKGLCMKQEVGLKRIMQYVEEKGTQVGALTPELIEETRKELAMITEPSAAADAERLMCDEQGFSAYIPVYVGHEGYEQLGDPEKQFFQILDEHCHEYGRSVAPDGTELNLCAGLPTSIECKKE